ncbi:MAG: AAA family ATPase [Actinomycetes bacterium]
MDPLEAIGLMHENIIDSLVSSIVSRPARNGYVRVITIDGPAGSGKTTLASALSTALNNCQVIHMDDLYSGWAQDLEHELTHRIIREILTPIASGETGSYARFDWYTNTFAETHDVPASDFLILEGVGSSHSNIRDRATISLWVEASSELLIERVVARDGEQVRDELIGWQKRESEFFAHHQVKENSEFLIRGD